MSLRVLPPWVIVTISFGLTASTAFAQPPRNRNPVMPQMQPIKKEGKLLTASPTQIQLSTNANETIFVMVVPKTQVSVTGTAEQDYLKSGVTVEFVAEVAKGGAVKDKITHLLVISPTSDRPIGLFSPESATPGKNGENDEGEKAKPLLPDPGMGELAPTKGRKPRSKKEADLFGADPLAKPSKGHNTAPQFPGTFTVRGTIRLCKNGAITVAAGHGPTIKAELASDVTIDVDMADVRVAQRDDKVTVSGLVSQARPNMVIAESITIELTNPLSGAKKHATRPERPAKTPATHAGKAKKGAGDADSFPGGE